MSVQAGAGSISPLAIKPGLRGQTSGTVRTFHRVKLGSAGFAKSKSGAWVFTAGPAR